MPETADFLQEYVISVPITIRRSEEEDLPNLEWFGLHSEHREIIHQAYQRQRRGDNLMLVAEINGHPVGQVWIDLERKRSEQAGLLWAARVFPWLQRLGIGRLLIHAAEQALRRLGYQFAELGVEKHNKACEFYERLGYRRSGTLYEEYTYTTPDGAVMRVPVDQWVYRKDLRTARPCPQAVGKNEEQE